MTKFSKQHLIHQHLYGHLIPSDKISIHDEHDMQEPMREVKMNSYVVFCYGPLFVDVLIWTDKHRLNKISVLLILSCNLLGAMADMIGWLERTKECYALSVTWYYIYIVVSVANKVYFNTHRSDFKLQSRYFILFWICTLGQCMNSLILRTMD